jgi:ligand-binding sensor domain-containing protein
VYGLGFNPVTQDLWLDTEQHGIFRSTGNGFTWTRQSPPATSFDSAHRIRDGNIYGMTFDGNGNVLFGSQGIWKSSKTGSGYTWTNVMTNHNTADGKGLGRDANGNLYYGHNHDPNDPTVVYRSTDDGNTWSAFDSGLPPSLEAHRFVVNTTDRKVYAIIEDGSSNNGWLYCTTNPVQ